ncbi:MAG: hypothetical protein OEW52_09865 [Thermoleophilia bacterium]|nr:hypothetical protein [Thermoleophilia bacterium]MDH4339628.1 hypothetical protein [Thermoleophilia bacterium]MDH5281438.1 hypothetical protein [Thermoleophilia bacterium]
MSTRLGCRRVAVGGGRAAAGIEGPFHDLRHTAITNDAAAGENPVALMTKAGHADMGTTRIYMHLAGVVFRDEADRLEARLLGESNLVPHEIPTQADPS